MSETENPSQRPAAAAEAASDEPKSEEVVKTSATPSQAASAKVEGTPSQAPPKIEPTPSQAPPEDPLAKAQAEAAKMKDAWIRTSADFDNFRKRTRRELEDARKGGREELLKELLPVFDNLERAMNSARQATEVKPVVDGLGMIMKQFVDILGRVGISKVSSTGSTFDPQVHEAIQQVETDDHPPGTVVAEVQAGYMNGERLVRAAMVVVAKPKTTVEETN